MHVILGCHKCIFSVSNINTLGELGVFVLFHVVLIQLVYNCCLQLHEAINVVLFRYKDLIDS